MITRMIKTNLILAFLFLHCLVSCESVKTRNLKVTATAYNSVRNQTNANPAVTYWGDTLKPGMKTIAVSHDLIDSGLTHGTEVEIKGFDGKYIVRDLMDDRWKNKIDIYMGENIDSALKWGEREVEIKWEAKSE